MIYLACFLWPGKGRSRLGSCDEWRRHVWPLYKPRSSKRNEIEKTYKMLFSWLMMTILKTRNFTSCLIWIDWQTTNHLRHGAIWPGGFWRCNTKNNTALYLTHTTHNTTTTLSKKNSERWSRELPSRYILFIFLLFDELLTSLERPLLFQPIW